MILAADVPPCERVVKAKSSLASHRRVLCDHWRATVLRAATLVIVLLCSTIAFAATPADAQAAAYPERAIRLIVPTTAGSAPDLVARVAAERLAVALGQPVVVDNRPGAIGTIGLNAVAKAPADGYTLGVLARTYLAAASLIPKMPYDTENDLSAVAVIAWNYQILSIRSDLPVRSVADLVALAKAEPGTLKYSSPSNASPSHLGMKLFELETGTRLVHVPYKGAPAAVTALLRRDVDIYLGGMVSIGPHVKSGAVRALATMAPRRLAANPEVPMLIELGFPDLEYTDFQGIVAPAGTPAEIIGRLSAALADIFGAPEIRDRLEQWSMEPAELGPAEFKRLIHDGMERSGRLIRQAHVTAD
jgi:tripartite-type tricarboxylate transporter receptor subunit TctC